MSLVGLQGQGSFLARDVSVLKPEEKGGLLSTLVSTQSRLLTTVAFNCVSGDFAVCDSHGQVFYFHMGGNSYQLVRLGGDSNITSICFLHSKLNYLASAYDDGSLVVIDLKQRKAVASMETLGGGVIHMLRCHPTHSLLVGLSVHASGGRTLDLYDMKTMGVAGSMPVEENVMDIKFAFVKDPKGGRSIYMAVLLEVSGVMFYDMKDFSLAFSCPFPDTERMPKWTAFSILDTFEAGESSEIDVVEDRDVEKPAFRFVTAGSNSSMYLWESPTVEEIVEYASEKAVGYCSIGAVVEMPVNVKTATFMQTLGDANVNNETYRLHIVASSGAGLVIDISGLALRGFGVKGMWTIVSDLSDSRLVGSIVSRVSASDAKSNKVKVSGMTGGGAVLVDVPTTSDENMAPNKTVFNVRAGHPEERIDGFTAASSYCYAVVSKDGAVRLFDSDYGVGFGFNAGIVLACREVYGDETRVPIMRYTLSNKGISVFDPAAKPKIAVKQQKGLRHGGARDAVQKEVKGRAASAKGHANVEKAKTDKELENKKSSKATTMKSRALRKAEESAKAAVKAKEAEKKMAAAQEAVRKPKIAEKGMNRRQGSRMSAAQEIEMARRASEDKDKVGEDVTIVAHNVDLLLRLPEIPQNIVLPGLNLTPGDTRVPFGDVTPETASSLRETPTLHPGLTARNTATTPGTPEAVPTTASAVEFLGSKRLRVVEEAVPPVKAGEVLIRTSCSCISTGTELKIYRGDVDLDQPADLTIKEMQEETMHYPMRYGYSLAGEVVACGEGVDPREWLGSLVFSFSPHASAVVAPVSGLMRVPSGISAEDATFLPSMETAVSLAMAARPLLGERVAVVGQGLIGQLTSAVLAAMNVDVTLVDVNPSRLSAAAASRVAFPRIV